MSKRYPRSVLASCVIPWDDDFKLIESTFREEIRHTIKK